MEKKRALGRGLEALLPRKPAIDTGGAIAVVPEQNDVPTSSLGAGDRRLATDDFPGERVIQIPLDQITRNRYQTRTTAEDDPNLNELADSIKAHGVMQPILVRPLRQSAGSHSEDGSSGNPQLTTEHRRLATDYELICGERRWLASRKAGKSAVPAIVRDVPSEQVLAETIIENLLREDLNPMQHARALERLAEEFHLTQEEVAARTGLSRPAVANFLRLTRLPEQLQTAVADGRLGFGQAKVLMALGNTPERDHVAKKVIEGRKTVRETEELVKRASFGVDDSKRETENEKPPQDPNVRAAELELQHALGCRVLIKDRNGKGRIVIEYQTLEDFDRVVEALK
ncbi:MAG: ParB/RepB/Spo0J family partition protein [Terriglobales bacterium]